MHLKSLALAALLALPASATLAEITVEQGYVFSAGPTARTGAAYMILHNDSETDDRLVSVSSDAAAMVKVHTSTDTGNGVMQMGAPEGGLVIAAQGSHQLVPGGDHIMLMGLTGPLADDATVTLTLQFETARSVTIEIPVDRTHKP